MKDDKDVMECTQPNLQDKHVQSLQRRPTNSLAKATSSELETHELAS